MMMIKAHRLVKMHFFRGFNFSLHTAMHTHMPCPCPLRRKDITLPVYLAELEKGKQ